MENKPQFLKVEGDQAHFLRIGQLVKDGLKNQPQNNLPHSHRKILFLPLLYFSFFALGLYFHSNAPAMVAAYACMGITGILMFLNLFHEATHGLLLRSKKANRLFLYLFDLMGPNSFIWIKRHNKLHHNYPNILGLDSDIEQSGPLQIFPHQHPEKYNRMQHIYVFLLYPLYLFNWIFIRDFRDFFQRGRVVDMFHPIQPVEYVKLFLFKGAYVGYTILLPIIIGVPVWQALISLMALTVTGSVFSLLVLLTPHVNAENEFPEILPGRKINSSWFIHQLTTTNDVSFGGWLPGSLMGNFHCHVAHHLFPNISYRHAPLVTQILEKYARENGLPYRRYGLIESLRLHYKLVKQNAVNAAEIFSGDL